MERDHSFIFRLGGGRLLGALVAVASAALPAGAQTVEFFAQENVAAVNRTDSATAIAYWLEEGTPNERWVYSAGYVTENDAGGNPHKRLAVYKYDAEYSGSSPTWSARAFFPR